VESSVRSVLKIIPEKGSRTLHKYPLFQTGTRYEVKNCIK